MRACRILKRCWLLGRPMWMVLSKRPGRNRASSRASRLLVAPMTSTCNRSPSAAFDATCLVPSRSSPLLAGGRRFMFDLKSIDSEKCQTTWEHFLHPISRRFEFKGFRE